ncbi:MAG TPA: hypothetical protein VGI97_12850, partial [Gemmatimonadaceae bacterium]
MLNSVRGYDAGHFFEGDLVAGGVGDDRVGAHRHHAGGERPDMEVVHRLDAVHGVERVVNFLQVDMG